MSTSARKKKVSPPESEALSPEEQARRIAALQQLNIQSVPISEINRAKYNPRRAMTRKELQAFERELDKFSCLEPLIFNKRTKTLIGGHKRLDWLQKHGATEVQVNVVDLDEADERVLNLALNSQGEGLWDYAKLDLLLDDMKGKAHSPESLKLDFEIAGLPNPDTTDWGPKLNEEAISEDSPKLKKILDARKRMKERKEDLCDAGFWFCLVFQSYQQKMEFLRYFEGLDTQYETYVDGEVFAEAVGRPVTPVEVKPPAGYIRTTLKEMIGTEPQGGKENET